MLHMKLVYDFDFGYTKVTKQTISVSYEQKESGMERCSVIHRVQTVY